jgi:flavin-dependent dehydrogenase
LKNHKLPEGATIAVIGGGPAGSFFALTMQQQMKRLGCRYRVVIVEKKKELGFYQDSFVMSCREGCNYCAGGISPRMSDVLKGLDLELPPQVIQSKIRSITVHGHWKNIELKIPKNRQMLSVYRGARPVKRTNRLYGFDSYLLENAVNGGAELITGNVYDVMYSSAGNLHVHYKTFSDSRILHADFVVFSCGVNQVPGMELSGNKIVQSLQRLIKGFQPPPVRRTLIFELEADPAVLQNRTGGIYFIESGSPKLRLDMCSIIPKEQFITVVLIGKSIDSATGESEVQNIIEQFLDLPHVKKILPKNVKLACVCRPNMDIGAASQPYGDRVAVIGDMATSRLYKDGILSAYHTASELARAITEVGIDRLSLKKAYGPAIRRFILDNHFGTLVFMLHGIMFSQPSLSRILYQAILTERKTKGQGERKLENILWKIASGDDRYQDIFLAMINPLTLWSIFTGGGLITLRNYLTELLFGLDWRGIGRFTTGVYKEELDAKSQKFKGIISELGINISDKPEFEKMYSIKIEADQERILHEIGKFGDEDQQFFRPRLIRVKRSRGEQLQVGSVLRYETIFNMLDFTAVLEKIYDNEMIIYRVDSGFPKGGILIFEIEKKGDHESVLSIYVAFNFHKGQNLFSYAFWRLFKFLFPTYLHDVLWNHSQCKLKDIVESEAS